MVNILLHTILEVTILLTIVHFVTIGIIQLGNTPSILLNNYYVDANDNVQIRDLNNAYFGNCIIYGSLTTEFSFDKNESGIFNYHFDHSLLKIDPNINTNTANFTSVIENDDLFSKIT